MPSERLGGPRYYVVCRGPVEDHRRRAYRSAFLLFMLALAATNSLRTLAQGTATLQGNIKDSTGSMIPGASVTLINEARSVSRTVKSDAAGEYAIAPLDPGGYVIQVEAPGFEKYVQTGVTVRVDEQLRADVTLTVGTQSQTVKVSGEALAINSENSVVQAVIDTRQMADLPLNGRNALQLMLQAPGVLPSPAVGLGTSFQPSGQQFVSASGSKANSINFLLDGGDNMDTYRDVANAFPNPDILQEFSFSSNNYSAEFGGRGGGVVNAVTKSGTNTLHGSLFEYVRNYALNANNFFATKGDGLKRNQYGGTIGGPVVIPHLYNGHDRTFFFFGIQETALRQTPNTLVGQVFTQLERGGNFSDKKDGHGNLIVIKDPLTGLAFPNNTIPTSRLDPVMQNFLKYIPVGNVGSGLTQYSTVSNNNELQYDIRVDQYVSKNDHVFFRLLKDNYSQPNSGIAGNLLSYANSLSQRGTNATLNYTKVFNPSLVGQMMFTFNRSNGLRGAVSPTTWPALGAALPTAGPGPDLNLFMTNYFNLNLYGNTPLVRNNFEYKPSILWRRAMHTFSFGLDAIRRQYNIPNADTQSNGQYTFSLSLTGDNGADALLGVPSTFFQASPYHVALRETEWAGWANDDLRLTQHLTINLGVRYEPFTPWVDQYFPSLPQQAQFRPGAQSVVYPNAPNGLLFYGDPGVSRGVASSNFERVSPRVGFAFDPFGDGKTSVRGGYGVFFDTLIPTEQVQQYAGNLPTFTVSASIAQPASTINPYAGSPSPFPATVPQPSTYKFPTLVSSALNFASANFTNSYTQQWNFGIQRQVGDPSIVASATYEGSKGTHLMLPSQANTPVYMPGQSTTANENTRRPYWPHYQSVIVVYPAAASNYDALVLSIEKRFTKGDSFLAQYTWSKNLDQTDNVTSGNTSSTPDPYDWAFNRGLSSSDIPHSLRISYLWQLPRLDNQKYLVRTVAGGWQYNGIFTLYSGFPFSIASGVDNSLTGVGGDRADKIGDPYPAGFNRGRAEWFNTAAFRTNAIGTFGTSGRNILRAPGTVNFDSSLFKNISIWPKENQYLQFRAEFFNTFNHPTFSAPTASVSSTSFGRILGAGSPRIIQLALRYSF